MNAKHESATNSSPIERLRKASENVASESLMFLLIEAAEKLEDSTAPETAMFDRETLRRAEETVQLESDPIADAMTFWRARAVYFAEQVLRATPSATAMPMPLTKQDGVMAELLGNLLMNRPWPSSDQSWQAVELWAVDLSRRANATRR